MRTIVGLGMLALAIMIAATTFTALSLTRLRVEVNFHIKERTGKENPIPFLQALSYSSAVDEYGNPIMVGNEPVIFYDMAIASSLGGRDMVEMGGEKSGVSDMVRRLAGEYGATEFAGGSRCFQYYVKDPVGGRIEGTLVPLNGLGIVCDRVKEFQNSKSVEGVPYVFPLPPAGDEARVSAQVLQIFRASEGQGGSAGVSQ